MEMSCVSCYLCDIMLHICATLPGPYMEEGPEHAKVLPWIWGLKMNIPVDHGVTLLCLVFHGRGSIKLEELHCKGNERQVGQPDSRFSFHISWITLGRIHHKRCHVALDPSEFTFWACIGRRWRGLNGFARCRFLSVEMSYDYSYGQSHKQHKSNHIRAKSASRLFHPTRPQAFPPRGVHIGQIFCHSILAQGFPS